MKPIAIIPARGGSKRLPRKNILPLNGKPMLAYIIIAAIKSKVFEKVIVSTEDREISTIALKYGAEVFLRDASLAKDSSTVVEVCLDVIKQFKIDNFCCLYATSALLSSEVIRASYQKFISESPSVLMGVSCYNYSPVQALKIDKYNNAALLLKDFEKIQSQLYPKLRVSNGTFCWAKKKSFMIEETFYSCGLKVFLVPENQVSDINTIEDYVILKKKIERII